MGCSTAPAARADEAFIRSSGDRGLVRFGYYPHNVHFIVTSAQMAGDMDTAIGEARRLATLLDAETATKIAWIQAIHAAPFLAMAQFAAPEAVLALPAPDPRLLYVTGMHHYARAVAEAQRGDQDGFKRELAALREVRSSGDFSDMIKQGVPAPELLLIAETAAQGRFAFAEGRFEEAAGMYREAAAIEDKIPYMEPPFWYYPMRQSLGAALYRAGRHEEASQAFRAALAQAPGNGWALYGLAESEQALGRQAEADAARGQLQSAWLGSREWLRMDRL